MKRWNASVGPHDETPICDDEPACAVFDHTTLGKIFTREKLAGTKELDAFMYKFRSNEQAADRAVETVVDNPEAVLRLLTYSHGTANIIKMIGEL